MNVVILMKFSWLAAPEIVILTTSGATSHENKIKINLHFSAWNNGITTTLKKPTKYNETMSTT